LARVPSVMVSLSLGISMNLGMGKGILERHLWAQDERNQ
jgi:hypothetical protein